MTDVNYALASLGAVCTASAYLAGYPASQANDASLVTKWKTANNINPMWLKVDLGAPQYIEALDVLGQAGASVGITISLQYCDDDASWQTVQTFSWRGGTTHFLTGGITARYWRMYYGGSQSAWETTEFQIWGPAVAPPPPTSPVPDYIEAWLDGIEANFVPTVTDWLAANP